MNIARREIDILKFETDVLKYNLDRIVGMYFAGGDWKDAIKKHAESDCNYSKINPTRGKFSDKSSFTYIAKTI